MRALVVALTACALVAVLGGQVCAAVDLLSGRDQQSDIQIGVYHPAGTGSMDNVREFDGRTLNLASIENLNVLGYSGPWQYSAFGNYLFAHDYDAAFGLNYENHFGLAFSDSVLTHRLAAIRAGNIVLASPTPGVDDSPNTSFEIVRRVTEINAAFVPDNNQAFRVVVGSWNQSKDGTRQQLGRWNSGTGNIKHVIAVPVHNDTSDTTFGGDLRLGQIGVVNYRYSDTKFGECGTGIKTIALLKDLTRIDSDTTTSTVKTRATINSRLYFTGVNTNRKRENTRATVLEKHPAGMSVNSVNAALTYLATDSLTFTARYRTLDQMSDTAPILGTGTEATKVTNSALSNKLKSTLFEASYSGIPHAFAKAGYEHKDVARSTQLTTEPYAEMEPSSKSDIVTGSIRYYPTQDLSLSANGSINNTGTAGYAGAANKQKQLNANATYMLRDNLAFYGDFSTVNEKNNLVRVPDVPNQGTDATTAEERKIAAGQGYHNDTSTGTLGAWYSLSSKLVMDANVSRIKTDSANLWILGFEPAYLPHVPPHVVSFNTQNNQWSTGLTYAMSPKWSFYGRYILSNSDGRGLLDTRVPSIYPAGVGPTWLPISVRQHTYTVGFSHDLSLQDGLSLDFSLSQYVDALNAANTGTYDVWRMAWSHKF